MPSNKDFSNLLNKLDVVTTPKNSVDNDNILLENEQLDCVIEEGAYYYIKIPVKGKKSPMKIENRKIQGKVLVYVSFFNHRPSLANYEQVFNFENFEIRNLDSVFRYDYLFLGIRALIFSKVSVSVVFGKTRIHVHDEKKRNKRIIEVDDEHIHIKSPKSKAKHKPKNSNVEVTYKKRMLSPEEVVQRNREWVSKRELVLNRRKLAMEKKKLKALSYINRQQIRLESERCNKLLIEAENNKRIQMQDLLRIVFTIKAGNIFREVLWRKRQHILQRLRKNTKVRTIQKFYKSTTRNFQVLEMSILRSQKLLMLYCQSSSKIVKCLSEDKVISMLKGVGICSKPRIKFCAFLESISKIQDSYRRYLVIKAKRMRMLIKLWDECKSFQMRRSLKKKNQMHQINISISQRLAILERFYLDYLKTYYLMIKQERSIFISELPHKEHRVMRKIPFDFMPSYAVMKQIIENVQARNESYNISE